MTKGRDSVITEAKEAFQDAQDAENENRTLGEEDLEFGRLGKQWDEQIASSREREGRPCLTINRMPSFVRQVINDARLNKPQIRVRPVDSGADVETAGVYNGIIRHIEQASNASMAYDTAIDYAVSCSFGYIRLVLEYASDNSFDLEPRVQCVENPFSIYGDPAASEPDGSDWNSAFVVDRVSEKAFEARYPKAEKVDWDSGEVLDDLGREDGIIVAEYWTRTETDRPILLMSDGTVVEKEVYEKNQAIFIGLDIVAERVTKSHKVVQRIVTGADVLEETEWAGRFIPIIPVYGERVNVKGKVHLRSMIRDGKDPQKMFNYWRSTSTELVALAPKAPWIGPKGTFASDSAKWNSAHSRSWAYIEYDGQTAPTRQPFAGVPAGVIQESLNASDDMKSTIGIHDASLGARSNETSGRAIMARQREGDVSTFHFIDNLSRGINLLGKQLIDIIPRVYTPGRMVRVLGEDSSDVQRVQLGERDYTNPDAKVYDLAAGIYDLVVDVGPSFTTRREESAAQMTEFVRSYPAAAPVIGDLLVKNLDWPGAEEIAERLKALVPAQTDPMQSQAVQEANQRAQAAEAENEALKQDKAIEIEKLKIDAYEAETGRMKAQADIQAQHVNQFEDQRFYGQ